jgi:hypothetical protein
VFTSKMTRLGGASTGAVTRMTVMPMLAATRTPDTPTALMRTMTIPIVVGAGPGSGLAGRIEADH